MKFPYLNLEIERPVRECSKVEDGFKSYLTWLFPVRSLVLGPPDGF